MKKAIPSLFLLVGALFFRASAIQYTTDLPVKLGEWTWNFAEAKQIADERHIPMVLFWGGASCTVCANVEYALEQEEAVAWQKKRNLVMVFQSGTEGEMKELVQNSSGTYPYICVYWNKGNGVTTTNRFSGVVSGPSRWPATGTTTAEHFINSVEMFIADYQPAEGNSGTFITGTTAGNQLEAEVGITERLLVPLSRNTASQPFAATNYVVAAYPAGTKIPVSTNLVEWAAGEAEKLVAIELPYTSPLIRAEDTISLTLLNDKGLVAGETNAKFVEPKENGPRNPDWIGEPFEFGRFTFDYDAATNAVAQKIAAGEKAYTIAFFTGALWCPYCKGMEDSLLAPGSAFYTWARDNNVALVEFDQGRASSPATAAGTRAPRLLTYEPDPRLDAANTVSGAGYLSRHIVEREDAEFVIARTTAYTQKWLAPETTAARLSQPTMLLVQNDEVIARFAAYRDGARVYDVDENIGRLNDFLKLWDGAGEVCGYRTTTTNSFSIGGETTAELQISARTVFYRMEGLAAGELNVTRTDNGAQDTVISLMQGAKTLATGTNKLSASVKRETIAEGDFVLKVQAYTSTSQLLFNPPSGEGLATSAFQATFRSALTLAPEEGMATAKPIDGKVSVSVIAGETYAFGGIADAELEAEFTKAGEGIWIAKATGTVTLTTASEAVTYQLWHPGRVGFASIEEEAFSEKTGIVEIAVMRSEGVSGRLTASVDVDAAQMSPGRFEIGTLDENGAFVTGPSTLVWEDSDGDEKRFALRIVDDFVNDGDQTLTLTLAGEGVVDGERAQKKITILEDDKSGAGVLAITSVKPAIVRNSTVYATTGTEVEFEVSRLEAVDGEVGATLTARVNGDAVEGLLSTNELVWCDRGRGAENVKSVRLAIPSDWTAGGTITVSLQGATGGAMLDPGAKTFTVSVISPDSVKFAASSAEWNGLAKVDIAESVGVEKPAEDAVVTIRKLSGSLPGGVKAAYDKTEGVLEFSGTPNRAGTFTAVYQAVATIGGVALAGEVFVATFTIRDIVEEFPVFGGTGTSAAKARTFRDVYLVEDQTKRVAGLVTLTIPASGKLSAKYVCSEGTISFSCTGWDTWNQEEGTLWALLTSRSPKYAEYWMYVTQHADGKVEVEVHDSRFPTVYLVRTLTEGDLWSSADNAHDWRGTYTLAMPVLAYKPASDYDIAYKSAAAGVPTFSLKMVTRSAINAGRFIWSGYLPNGKAISGSAVLNREDDVNCVLPIFFRNSSELFASLVTVEGGHADAYESDDPAVKAGGPHKFGLRAITASGNALNWWGHTDTRSSDLSFAWTYDAYGSFFVEGESFSDCLVASGVSDEVDFTTNLGELPDSEVYGAAGGAEPVAMKVSGQDFAFDSGSVKLAVNRRTGMVSGKVALPFEAGEVKANFRGVALPGWTGCGCHDEGIDLPLVMGACWFTDKVLYTDPSTKKTKWLSVRRGCEVTCETKVELGE